MSHRTEYVHRVLVRASKYTWISGEDVRRIAFHAARRVSFRPDSTVNNTIPSCCHIVGMLLGGVPLDLRPGCKGYGKLLKIVKKHTDKTRVMIELLKLQEELQR